MSPKKDEDYPLGGQRYESRRRRAGGRARRAGGRTWRTRPSTIKELREKTGAGIMDCKRRSKRPKGDLEQGRRSSCSEQRARAMPRRRPAARRSQGLVEATSTLAAHRRDGRAELRDRLRRAHRRVQARSRARSRCRSRRSTRVAIVGRGPRQPTSDERRRSRRCCSLTRPIIRDRARSRAGPGQRDDRRGTARTSSSAASPASSWARVGRSRCTDEAGRKVRAASCSS